MKELASYISINKEIRFGKPCIVNTRITVSDILQWLASGMTSDEILQDFTSTTRERIASCSKWLSAALIMTFVDEGKLSLNDSVGKFLPVMTANGKGNIRIWQCLSHTTGIKTGSLKESLDEMKAIQSMDEAIEMIAKQPLEGTPGKT